MAEKRPHRPIEPAIYAYSKRGRRCYRPPECDVPARSLDELLPPELRRERPPALPEVDEPTLIRHYVRLSQLNYCIDTGFYPLGSCTMKYNPKVNERLARLLNWVLNEFSGVTLKPPYSAAEVERLRADPLRDPVSARKAVLGQ